MSRYFDIYYTKVCEILYPHCHKYIYGNKEGYIGFVEMSEPEGKPYAKVYEDAGIDICRQMSLVIGNIYMIDLTKKEVDGYELYQRLN